MAYEVLSTEQFDDYKIVTIKNKSGIGIAKIPNHTEEQKLEIARNIYKVVQNIYGVENLTLEL